MMDEPLTAGPVHLSRNKTERHRLQGLVRSNTISNDDEVGRVKTFGEKVKVWMINDGTLFPVRPINDALTKRYESILPYLLGYTPYSRIWNVNRSLQDEG
jgi:hypothetical protein